MAKKTSTQALGFEEQIWDAACKLRGNIDASEYKNVVLGLIFLKYISDNFEAKHAELVEEGEGFGGGSRRVHVREHLLGAEGGTLGGRGRRRAHP